MTTFQRAYRIICMLQGTMGLEGQGLDQSTLKRFLKEAILELRQEGEEMNCPFCDTELVYDDYYGRLCAHQDGKMIGEIYLCPNGKKEDGSCESGVFRVPGAWHTIGDSEELHPDYPC